MYSVLDLRLENHCWIARRWPGLSLAQRHRIVALAANRLGEPYNLSSLVFEFVNPGSGKRREIAGRGLVCSRLCDRSIALALLESGFPADQIAFSTGPRNWVTPAILSQTTKLQDVSINWRNSASSSDVS